MKKIIELQVVTKQGVKTFETWSEHSKVDEIVEIGTNGFFVIKSKGMVIAEVRQCPVVIEYEIPADYESGV